jgi:glycosyltransferase involved in cell wall biosynthesis
VPLRWPPHFLFPQDPFTHKTLQEIEGARTYGIAGGASDLQLLWQNNVTRPPNPQSRDNSVAVIFFENNPLSTQDIENLRQFPLVIAGCSWGRDALAAQGITNLTTVMQGVDLDLFRPMSKRRFKDRFVVFSGSKLEYRKGQDLVVRAFSRFAARHPEALLITAWRSPWEKDISGSINWSGRCPEFNPDEDPEQSIPSWLMANGIAPHQFLCLNPFGNRLMPEVLREVDVALFPCRSEGGTNLIAKEALACGVPCILSANTGHLDLIGDGNCIPLTRQGRIPLAGPFEGWGEAHVDEIIDALERVYDGSARPDASLARQTVADRSWQRYYTRLESHLESL